MCAALCRSLTMANANSVILDLCNDNFDLANFPSLPFPVENDDLNLMARMGSLFDASLKEGSVHNAQAFSQAPQCAQTAAQTFAQSQQLQSQPATMSLTSTQAFGSLSEPMLSQQNQPQPLLAEQPAMPSFPKGYVQTGMTMQVPLTCKICLSSFLLTLQISALVWFVIVSQQGQQCCQFCWLFHILTSPVVL